MNRLHRIATGALLAVTSTLLPASAFADWSPAHRSARPVPSLRQGTPQAQYLHSMGISGPETKIKPGRSGLASTPKIPLRPGNLLKSPQAPRGTFYGVVNRFKGIVQTGEAYLGHLDLASGRIKPLHTGAIYSPYASDDYLLQTNGYRRGEVICPSVYIAEEAHVVWDFIDLESGDYIRTLDFGNNMFANSYSMTYDADKDLIYMVCIDDKTDGQFSVADPGNDYEVTYIGNLRGKGNFIAAIAYNMADHQLYAFNNFNEVFIVNPDNGNLMEAGYLELPSGEQLFTEGIAGQVTYSPADGMFVCIYRDNSIQASRILYIHPETFEVFEGEVVTADNTPYITAVFCTDEFAEADAPELPLEPKIDFRESSLTGAITIDAPRYTYAGVSLGSTDVLMKLVIDGEEYLSELMKPGDDMRTELTLSEGEHQLELSAWIGDLRSPLRKMTFYTGHDTPAAPANVRLDGTTLSWDAPGRTGIHGGYVDTNALTYQAYRGKTLLNATPVSATKLEIEVPDDYDRYTFSVVASANGHSSAAGTLTTLFGKPLGLPLHHTPTADEARLYTVVNANHDERAWTYINSQDTPDIVLEENLNGWCMTTGYTQTANDWLILPAINFSDAEALYSLTYSIRGLFSDSTIESYDIWVGEAPTPEAMYKGTCISTVPSYMATNIPDEFFQQFGVPHAGTYYVGFHFTGAPGTQSQGIVLSEFDIHAVGGKTSAIPGDPTDVLIEPAPMGQNYVDVALTMPMADISMHPLDPDAEITVTVTDALNTLELKGKPGKRVSGTLDLPECGHYNIFVTPGNDMGNGYTRSYYIYVGIDRPTPPSSLSVKPSDDDLSLHLQWTVPGNVGENKGYVDTDGLTYSVYVRSGSNTPILVGETTDLSFIFSPFSTSNPTQASYSIGVSAKNEGGESYETQFVDEHLGAPYELPMVEEWNPTKFDCLPYTYLTSAPYDMTTWENISTMNGLGVGDPAFRQGGLVCYTRQGDGDTEMILPKATTKGISSAKLILRYWDYANAPESIKIYGRHAGQYEKQLLGELPFSHPAKGEWVDGEIILSGGYLDASWVEFRIDCHFPGIFDNEYLILDGYSVIADVDHDLKVTAINGPQNVSVGQTASYIVTVANAGKERISGDLSLSLADASGHVYASSSTAVPPLNSSQTFEYDADFDINGIFREIEDLQLTATLDSDDDNTSNNTRTLPVKVAAGSLPVINDLKGTASADGNVALSWSTPPTEYGDYEDFESLVPFAISETLGMWGNRDLDHLVPISITNNATGEQLQWEGSDSPQGWTVVDIEAIGHMNDPRLAPHSGKKVLMARSGDSGDDTNPLQSSKWLISPEVKGGSELSFWMSTLASDILEYIELWYSTTGTELDEKNATSTRNGDFRRARTFSKDGAEAWEFISCQLPANTRHFALRYCSYDGAAAVIDDISFTPATMLSHDIAGYSVYRSDEGGAFRNIGGDVTSTSFTDSSRGDKSVTYYVATRVATADGQAEGPRSNTVAFEGSGVDHTGATALISAARGEILLFNLEGEKYAVTSADGMTVARGTCASQHTAVAVAPGIYIVDAGRHKATLLVK